MKCIKITFELAAVPPSVHLQAAIISEDNASLNRLVTSYLLCTQGQFV